MMRQTRVALLTRVMLLSAFVALGNHDARAQSAPANFRDAIDYPALLQQLKSPLDTSRAAAYYALLFEPSKGAYDGGTRVQHLLAARPALAPAIRRALIGTLGRENATLVKHTARVLPPPFAQYYPHLVTSVAALKDVGAIPALIGALPSVPARDGLLALGAAAVPKLRVAARAKDSTIAASARQLLGEIGAKR